MLGWTPAPVGMGKSSWVAGRASGAHVACAPVHPLLEGSPGTRDNTLQHHAGLSLPVSLPGPHRTPSRPQPQNRARGGQRGGGPGWGVEDGGRTGEEEKRGGGPGGGGQRKDRRRG